MPQMTDTVEAKRRENSGKGAAHKLRKAGEVPAVLYGPGAKPGLLALDPYAFGLQRTQFGPSHIYTVKIDGDAAPFKALVREMQIDPVSQRLLHVDLYALDMKKALHINVVLELEGKPAGLLDGGILQQVMRHINVACLPSAIPEKLTVDVSSLTVGQSVKASDIKLPAGVKLVGRGDQAVATVVAPQEEEVAAPTVTAEGAVAGAEGAAAGAEGAAPAADAAAGAASAKGGEKAEAKEAKGKK